MVRKPTRGEAGSLRDLAQEAAKSSRLWILAVRNDDGYASTDHLMTGDEGAIAIGGPARLLPGQRGWIGSGSNRFEVRDIREFPEAPGVSCCLGRVVSGGFHVSKDNLEIHRDGPTAT